MNNKTLADLSGNIYRNWHKPTKWYKTKKYTLNDSTPVEVKPHANTGMAIHFRNDDGKQISFILTKETANYLKDKIVSHFNQPT
jgi:hypothetical protein